MTFLSIFSLFFLFFFKFVSAAKQNNILKNDFLDFISMQIHDFEVCCLNQTLAVQTPTLPILCCYLHMFMLLHYADKYFSLYTKNNTYLRMDYKTQLSKRCCCTIVSTYLKYSTIDYVCKQMVCLVI